MEIIDINSKFYPEMLKKINDPPQKLFVLGNINNLNSKSIAIIGSRNCTEYGKTNGLKFGYELSKEEFTIVSGMAIGVDTEAHRGALKAKGKTIAVLGSGFDNIYPKENEKLFEDILKNNGTVISEYAPYVKKAANNFRRRNRIISGLSMGILVIEAAEKSGTGITINYARRQKKPIFGIPNNIENKKGVGINRLLKRDGILVTNVNDILSFFKMEKAEQIKIEDLDIYTKVINIKPEYKEIYETIKKGTININQISRKLQINISELNSKLLMMELEELIEANPGNNYKIKNNLSL